MIICFILKYYYVKAQMMIGLFDFNGKIRNTIYYLYLTHGFYWPQGIFEFSCQSIRLLFK